MCGFAGAFSFDDVGKKFHALTSSAIYSLRHRGPDDEGLLYRDNFSVGHRRLKILDLSPQAHQPMLSDSKDVILAFNGEIFNFDLLRRALERKGHVFQSRSDTEVILLGYQEWGTDVFDKLDGEFALAIFNEKKNELILARDRFGIKPLYFYRDEHVFLFSSELRGILKYGVPRVLDQTALQLYFHLNYIPSPYSIIQGVKKQEKGTFLSVVSNQVKYYVKPPSDVAEENHERALRSRLQHAVEKRLYADVPVGCFLSGGLDSTVITGIAAGIKPGLPSFSIGFPDQPFFDETGYAGIAAKKFGTTHTVFEVKNRELSESMHFLFSHLDEPFADSSSLPVQLLCKSTAEYVKVVLSGDGADELFGGYNKHEAERRIASRPMPALLAKAGLSMLSGAPVSRSGKTGNTLRKARKFLSSSLLSRPDRYWNMAGFPDGRNILTAHSIHNRLYGAAKKQFTCEEGNDLNDVLEADIRLVLENDMLVKVDRMSMAHSLEVRVPYLAHDVSSFVRSLPASRKISSGGRKLLLRNAFPDLVPDLILARSKKGFEVPLLEWFKGELKPMLEKEIGDITFLKQQNIFNPEALRQLFLKMLSGAPDDSPATLWAFLVFQNWYRNYFLN
ncbi:MAG: asparagine synthase (glutamine-hydrolyzing) [Bacteroidia bacterium]|nr:asparagine synthase (glutamine-hydrolyzing) [Bacteroidia bacterium]